MKTPPTYMTPSGWTCPNCGEETKIVPDLCEFSHEFGIEYPSWWGQPMCSECEHPVEDVVEYPEYESDY